MEYAAAAVATAATGAAAEEAWMAGDVTAAVVEAATEVATMVAKTEVEEARVEVVIAAGLSNLVHKQSLNHSQRLDPHQS